MKKLRLRFIVFLILIGFSFLPIGYAEECDYDYLKQLASVVDVHSEIDYEAVEVGLYSRNIVTLVGLNNDIYAITDDGSVGFFYEDMRICARISRILQSVLMTSRSHLFPFRTQKLSSIVPKVLGWRRPGRIGRCRHCR